jgi:ketosteroid isomerase-like protein
MRMKSHGRFTKIGIDYRFATVSTFRDGKVARMDRYGDRGEALEAVGLAR